jgi:hypothetical protein
MRKGISIAMTPADRVQLEAIVCDRNSPQKHVWRSRYYSRSRRCPRARLEIAPCPEGGFPCIVVLVAVCQLPLRQ